VKTISLSKLFSWNALFLRTVDTAQEGDEREGEGKRKKEKEGKGDSTKLYPEERRRESGLSCSMLIRLTKS